jgi:hypothetical protein
MRPRPRRYEHGAKRTGLRPVLAVEQGARSLDGQMRSAAAGRRRPHPRALQTDGLEQLGYQSEAGTWRNLYLTGA